ncbi:hypothetical protein GCM10009624_33320 [Gordonia sinesedis]
MTGAHAAVTVVTAATPARLDDVARLLRELVAATRTPIGAPARSWAILGELRTEDTLTDNERVLAHDRIGRQAVRLAVDKVLSVGDTRAVRGLHQGVVMEGSWGDEARLADSVADARDILRTDPGWRPAPGDVVLVAGPTADLAGLADIFAAEFGLAVRDGTDAASAADGTDAAGAADGGRAQ